MTETTTGNSETAPTKKRAGGLEGMLLPELKQMAGGLGIKGAGGMRKSQLVEAIRAAQSGGAESGKPAAARKESSERARDEDRRGRPRA